MSNSSMLIVDTDPIHSRVLTRTLRQRGFDVRSARNATAAMDIANSSQPAYVILEQQLNDGSGLSLIRPLRNLNPETKILVLTHLASIQSAVHSIKLGAFNYMAKPAYVEEIIGALGIAAESAPQATPAHAKDSKRNFDGLEWRHIVSTLRNHDGNLSAAALTLGMYRRTLQRKLESYTASTGKNILEEIRKSAPLRRRRRLRASLLGTDAH